MFSLLILIPLVCLGVLAIVIGTVAVIGARLPRDHVATVTLQIPQPLQVVWDTVMDIERLPEWRRGVSVVRLERMSSGHRVWVEQIGGQELRLEETEVREPVCIVRRIADDSLPFGGTWTFAFRSTGSGCEVVLTEHGFVKNAIFRFVGRYVLRNDASARAYLSELAIRHGTTLPPRGT